MKRERSLLRRILPVLGRELDFAAGLSVLATIALFSGCHDTTGEAGGWLTATISRAADTTGSQTTYVGTGDFNVGRDPGAGVSVSFGLYSRGTDTSAGQGFSLYRPDNDRPGPGRYELAPLKVTDGHLEGFTAYYHRTAAGRSESFTALSGYLEVSASSGDRVEGVFHFIGVLYCLANETPGPDDRCVGPNTITPGAPQVEVTGSFSAVPIKLGPDSLSVP